MTRTAIVPVVATEEMWRAGMSELPAMASEHERPMFVVASIYAAMLAAAPPFVVTDEFVVSMCNAYDKARGDAALSDPAEFPAMYAAIEAVLGGGA